MSTDSSARGGSPARRAVDPDAPTAGGTARRAADQRSFPGSLGWTVLGTLIPGLGLWRAGRRITGGLGLAMFALVIGGGIYAFVNPTLVQSLTFASGSLEAIAIGLLVVAVLWVALIGFTHLSLRPANPTLGQRAAGAAVVGLLAFVVAAPMALGANLAWTTAGLFDKIFSDEETPNATQPTIDAVDPWQDKDRLSFLIIGGDSGNDRSSSLGDRTDTIIVASIDTHTGATTLFTLPRNTARMPFPSDSPLHKYYPNGFYDGANPANAEYFLNAMYRNVPARVPNNLLGKTSDLGASVMKVSVGEALGLDIDYYVKVNMDGFRQFVNAIDGITVNINYKIPIGGQTDAGIPPDGYLKPGPNQHLDGKEALWYARGRYGLDDYKRMERQRCVINAVVQQTTPEKVLANYQSIAKAGESTIQTDVPRSLLGALVDLGLKVKDTELRSIVFTPDTGFTSASPDWPTVQKRVLKALKETSAGVTATPEPTASASSSASGSASPTASASPTKKSTAKARSDDLDYVCGYHPEDS